MCCVVLIILATVVPASNPWPIGACLTGAGTLHMLGRSTAQQAGGSQDRKAAALLRSGTLGLVGAEESVWLMDSYVQTPEL